MLCRFTWNHGQLEKARNIGGKQTDHIYNRIGGVIMQIFNIVILIALAERIVHPDCKSLNPDGTCGKEDSDSVRRKVVGVSIFEACIAIVLGLVTMQRVLRSWDRQLRRIITIFAFLLFVVMFVLYIVFIGKNSSAGFTDLMLIGFANITLATIIVQLTLYIAPYNEFGVSIVDSGYYLADSAIGLVTFFFVFMLSILPLVDSVQSLLLFNKDVLAQSRFGRQSKQQEEARGYAGQRRRDLSMTQSAPPPTGAGGGAPVIPAGAVAPIPAAAADPISVLPPRRFMDLNMTVGMFTAQQVLGGAGFRHRGTARDSSGQLGPSRSASGPPGPPRQGSGTRPLQGQPRTSGPPAMPPPGGQLPRGGGIGQHGPVERPHAL
jgi:hypothetical protein